MPGLGGAPAGADVATTGVPGLGVLVPGPAVGVTL